MKGTRNEELWLASHGMLMSEVRIICTPAPSRIDVRFMDWPLVYREDAKLGLVVPSGYSSAVNSEDHTLAEHIASNPDSSAAWGIGARFGKYSRKG